MKVIHEYEPSDIDINENPIHSWLFSQILIIGLTGFKKSDDSDDPTFPFRRIVANFLNSAERAGISIAKTETVPPVFRESLSQ